MFSCVLDLRSPYSLHKSCEILLFEEHPTSNVGLTYHSLDPYVPLPKSLIQKRGASRYPFLAARELLLNGIQLVVLYPDFEREAIVVLPNSWVDALNCAEKEKEMAGSSP